MISGPHAGFHYCSCELKSREPSCHQSSGDNSGHGVLFFVFPSFCFLPTYLPTCPLTTYDRMDIVTF
ncbi:hypothetical protein BO85DRAFT_251335 [Aspergillus piperis CBS 112811]|uniref:Uncharacterized protein n=1 Tax=Aspergillus piperis CBS 112811 TaxID=1448313 RepID=A0A8G1VPM3_9EURO|nr:hypothetical protein BO85DRAFT_251335 [Aspergillus piperis CBS 112811]RAH59842.1 hypothetical protein BO85DRAFT_251335 [Aspergillus piperis CBS 112811]